MFRNTEGGVHSQFFMEYLLGAMHPGRIQQVHFLPSWSSQTPGDTVLLYTGVPGTNQEGLLPQVWELRENLWGGDMEPEA